MSFYRDYEPKHRESIIYKYKLTDSQQIILIKGFQKVLSTKIVDDKICVWVLLDPNGKPKNVKFYICGTGNSLPKDITMCTFIDTLKDGSFFWHLFYRETV